MYKQELIRQIKQMLTKLSSENFNFDRNALIENFYLYILETAYDLNLINLNVEQPNFPAIDLADSNLRIGVQITKGNVRRLQTVVERFIKFKLYNSYEKLFIFFITDTHIDFTDTVSTNGLFELKVFNNDDLIQRISTLDTAKVESINRYFKDNLNDFDVNDINPKIIQLEKFKNLIINPKNEVEITSFLELKENEFILKTTFPSKRIFAQINCEWQSEKERASIKPDFFVEHHNGFSNIVELKLPNIKTVIVGVENRETFSSYIHSYIAQTRDYKEYFEDPNNRNWLFSIHTIKVLYPERTLVLGRRSDFINDAWKKIQEDYKELRIFTYDDLIDNASNTIELILITK